MWKTVSANHDSEEYTKWKKISDNKNEEGFMNTNDLTEPQRILQVKKTMNAIKPLLQNLESLGVDSMFLARDAISGSELSEVKGL